MSDIELKRRKTDGTLTGWPVNDDGTQPSSDEMIHLYLGVIMAMRNLQYARDASDRMRTIVDGGSISINNFIDDRQKAMDMSRLMLNDLTSKMIFT